MKRMKQLREAFQAADINGDGHLDLQEFINLYHARGVNISQDDAKALFEEKDRDLDSFISFKEFSGEITEAERIWRALDKQGKGTLTHEEVKSGLKKYKKSLGSSEKASHLWTTRLDEAFADKTFISYEDFCGIINPKRSQSLPRLGKSESVTLPESSGSRCSSKISLPLIKENECRKSYHDRTNTGSKTSKKSKPAVDKHRSFSRHTSID